MVGAKLFSITKSKYETKVSFYNPVNINMVIYRGENTKPRLVTGHNLAMFKDRSRLRIHFTDVLRFTILR